MSCGGQTEKFQVAADQDNGPFNLRRPVGIWTEVRFRKIRPGHHSASWSNLQGNNKANEGRR